MMLSVFHTACGVLALLLGAQILLTEFVHTPLLIHWQRATTPWLPGIVMLAILAASGTLIFSMQKRLLSPENGSA
jgi:hypothetical protein